MDFNRNHLILLFIYNVESFIHLLNINISFHFNLYYKTEEKKTEKGLTVKKEVLKKENMGIFVFPVKI